MPTGAPFITLDATGNVVAQFPDGSVVPVQATPAPQMMAPGPQGGQTFHAVPSVQGAAAAPVTEGRVVSPVGTESVPGGHAAGGGFVGGGYSAPRSYDYSPRPPATGGSRDADYGGGGGLPRGDAAGSGVADYSPAHTVYLRDNPAPVDYGDPRGLLRQTAVPDISGYAGGGGGGTSGAYDALRSKGYAMAAKVRGMASGIGSGGSSGYSSGSSYGDYSSGGTTEVDEPKMRGRYARGLDPTQAMELSYRPTSMLPRVFPGLGPETPLYQELSAMPAAQMAMLSRRKGTTASGLANGIGTIYERAGETGALPSTGRMLNTLMHGKGIQEMFQGVKAGKGDYESYTAPGYVYGQEPLGMGEAASAYGSFLDAALYGEPLATQAKYSSLPGGYGSYLIDKWGSRALKRPAGKGMPITKFVGRRIFR